MRFAVYRPPQGQAGAVPVLTYLAGLTCTEETFMIKAGAQRLAAEAGLMLVAPDTSPRGAGIAGEDEDWDFGTGAGFYVDASAQPWAAHYNMYTYVTAELPELIAAEFPVREGAAGIFGHSMGGHGALICALKDPGAYRSVSAFAPIVAPSQCPWGERSLFRLPRARAQDLARLGRHRAGVAIALRRHDPYRSGRGRSVPGRATQARALRGGVRGRRPAA